MAMNDVSAVSGLEPVRKTAKKSGKVLERARAIEARSRPADTPSASAPRPPQPAKQAQPACGALQHAGNNRKSRPQRQSSVEVTSDPTNPEPVATAPKL